MDFDARQPLNICHLDEFFKAPMAVCANNKARHYISLKFTYHGNYPGKSNDEFLTKKTKKVHLIISGYLNVERIYCDGIRRVVIDDSMGLSVVTSKKNKLMQLHVRP